MNYKILLITFLLIRYLPAYSQEMTLSATISPPLIIVKNFKSPSENEPLLLLQQSKLYSPNQHSETQNQIDQALVEIFQSWKELCQLFPSKKILSYSLGASFDAALKISEACNTKNLTPYLPKNYTKKYYFLFTPPADLEIESWTNIDNATIIFPKKNFSTNDLKNILLHEIAIATDSKINMYLSTFFRYEDQHTTHDGDTLIVNIPSMYTPLEERLRVAFNESGEPNIAQTFATLRAFNIENMFYGYRSKTITDHKDCVQAFLQIYKMIKKNNQNFKFQFSGLNAEIINLIEDSARLSSQQSAEITLNEILDEKFFVKEKESGNFLNRYFSHNNENSQTFCQYMATPRLTNHPALSLFSRGPRPRLSGGFLHPEPNDENPDGILNSIFEKELQNGGLREMSQ